MKRRTPLNVCAVTGVAALAPTLAQAAAMRRLGIAGVPTRNEIDYTQEFNYRYIAEMIADLDYDGYVSHEWRPTPGRDVIRSIEEAIAIMDV